MKTYDAIVVGAGIAGLCSAYHLRRRGLPSVAVVERFQLGHDRGSSHGATRITRSGYDHPDYVRLMQHVHAEEWPRLERDLGRTLIHRTPGCFFGPPTDRFRQYRDAVAAAGANVEPIPARKARQRFPQFTFADSQEALLDHTAGVIAAADAIAGLIEWLRVHGVEFMEGAPATELRFEPDAVCVATERGQWRAGKVAVTAGAWIDRLLPFLKPRLCVVRQIVGYFQLTAPEESLRPGSFPVWCYLHDRPERFFYGLPEFGPAGSGVKLARHRTQDHPDDPDAAAGDTEAEMAVLRQFAAEQFAAPLARTARVEHCLYTNTPDEDFIVDRLAADGRAAFASACSGHGFKFGPLVGRTLADLLIDGKPEVAEFARVWPRFQWRDRQVVGPAAG